jgi:hypothetical protein
VLRPGGMLGIFGRIKVNRIAINQPHPVRIGRHRPPNPRCIAASTARATTAVTTAMLLTVIPLRSASQWSRNMLSASSPRLKRDRPSNMPTMATRACPTRTVMTKDLAKRQIDVGEGFALGLEGSTRTVCRWWDSPRLPCLGDSQRVSNDQDGSHPNQRVPTGEFDPPWPECSRCRWCWPALPGSSIEELVG